MRKRRKAGLSRLFFSVKPDFYLCCTIFILLEIWLGKVLLTRQIQNFNARSD